MKQPVGEYLFHLVHDFVDFRMPELQSVCEMISMPDCIKNHNYSDQVSAAATSYTYRIPILYTTPDTNKM